MQLNSEILNRITYLTGSADIAERLAEVPSLAPFDERIISFLNDVSKELLKDKRSRGYSDVVTFGFWIRKSSIYKLKERFDESRICLGKGVAFHIAPSNVPVNFAYSLASGLVCGNANVVRVPSKEFPQVEIITDAFNAVLDRFDDFKSYVICVRYDRDKAINDLFSSVADVRIVWGGDQTIAELRKSPLPPRSREITFADRYSLAVIDSDSYLNVEDKTRIAEDFYNDTFFSDQNACTSPRLVVWMGNRINEAKKLFWDEEHKFAEKKYVFQPIQAVSKLTSAYRFAAEDPKARIESHKDNLIIRVKVPEITDGLMDYRDNSGYFYEYDCKTIMEIVPIVNDNHCQTITYIGNKDFAFPLIEAGVKGIDRIVPMGKTMDFDLIWDGYNLPAFLTRTVVMA